MSGAIERIVVSLDVASENSAAIETAARLAAQTKAPLHGIFVENEDLLRLCCLPFARQVTPGFGIQPLTLQQTESHLRTGAERARRELAAAARQHALTWSFEVVRGASEDILSALSARDLVVGGALTRPIAGYFRVAGSWWSSIEIVPGPFLLARQVRSTSAGVAALLLGRNPASVRLLQAVAQIAEAGGGAADGNVSRCVRGRA